VSAASVPVPTPVPTPTPTPTPAPVPTLTPALTPAPVRGPKSSVGVGVGSRVATQAAIYDSYGQRGGYGTRRGKRGRGTYANIDRGDPLQRIALPHSGTPTIQPSKPAETAVASTAAAATAVPTSAAATAATTPVPASPATARREVAETANLLANNLRGEKYSNQATAEFARLATKAVEPDCVVDTIKELSIVLDRGVDLIGDGGIALANLIRYYGTDVLERLTIDQVTRYLSDDIRATRLALVLAQRCCYQNDQRLLEVLLERDSRTNRGSLAPYPQILKHLLITQSDQPDMAIWLYQTLPMSVKIIRGVLRDLLGADLATPTRLAPCTAIVELMAAIYNDQWLNSLEVTSAQDQSLLPLLTPVKGTKASADVFAVELEEYLRIYCEYSLGIKLMAEVINWKQINEYSNVVIEFLDTGVTLDELEDYDEQVAMQEALEGLSDHHPVKLHYQSLTDY
jgi:hypothetical protein